MLYVNDTQKELYRLYMYEPLTVWASKSDSQSHYNLKQ